MVPAKCKMELMPFKQSIIGGGVVMIYLPQTGALKAFGPQKRDLNRVVVLLCASS